LQRAAVPAELKPGPTDIMRDFVMDTVRETLSETVRKTLRKTLRKTEMEIVTDSASAPAAAALDSM
jgi:DNA topoisomerase VI subunit B